MIWTIIIFLIILSVLVIFHELGHFLFARLFKVKVIEFGLGFPPRAKTIYTDKKGTIFSLNWLPFDGYVAMAGEDAPIDGNSKTEIIIEQQNKKKKSNSDQETEFHLKPAWQRFLIICAGPVFSLILGIICFTFLYMANGIPTKYDLARIVAVSAESPAAMAGIMPEVGIIQLISEDNIILNSPNVTQVIDFTAARRGQNITMITTGICQKDSNNCHNQNKKFQIYIRHVEETPAGEGAIGISFAEQFTLQKPWWQMPFFAAYEGIKQSLWLTGQIISALGSILSRLFSGQSVSSDIAGPVGIVSAVEKEGLFNQGIWLIIGFAGMLSINLAVMNMLPIPAVDGGRALLIILEKFISRSKIAKIEGALNATGFIALILLMIIITFHDIFKIMYN